MKTITPVPSLPKGDQKISDNRDPMQIKLGDSYIGSGNPTYMIAEMSANHGGDIERAIDMIHAAKEAGANAIKLQTYTADTLTLDCQNPPFYISKGPWKGQTLYNLYKSAYTPWEWYPLLKEIADKIGISIFSTPFDESAIDFLVKMECPAFKIASHELIDHALIKKAALTGKPLIISTGKATLSEIDEAVRVARAQVPQNLILLKCTSSYPAPPEDMNLRTIPHLQDCFGLPVGLSDHTKGIGTSIAAVALGACMIEKHFILDRKLETPDSFFSLIPEEFKSMTDEIRSVERALGSVKYETELDLSRRGLWAYRDIKAGEKISNENVKSLRPGGGILPSFLPMIKGKRIKCDLVKGSPILWEHIE